MTARRYPIQSLIDLTGKSMTELLGGRGRASTNASAWRAIRDHGLTPYKADQLACANGRHPRDVWPSWDQDEFDELSLVCVECETRFIPSRKGMKFCTHACGHRHRNRERRRERYATDPEYAQRMRDEAKAYYAEAKRAARLYRRNYYQANKERERARQAEYDRRNREKVNAARRARYARQKAAA